jgi:hypothetical protein
MLGSILVPKPLLPFLLEHLLLTAFGRLFDNHESAFAGHGRQCKDSSNRGFSSLAEPSPFFALKRPA